MFMAPLPEVRASLTRVPGAVLQKPRFGTIFRRTRSASGIGEMAYEVAGAGGFGRNGSFRTRRRYSAGRLSAGGAVACWDVCRGASSAAANAGEASREPSRPAAVPLVLRKSLRFTIALLEFYASRQATQWTQSMGLRRPSFKWTSTAFRAGSCSSQAAFPGCSFAARPPGEAETASDRKSTRLNSSHLG